MGRKPQVSGFRDRVEVGSLPPPGFVAGAMNFTMMAAAQRDGELVAHLAAQSPVLRKAQVMSVGRLAAANETGMLGNEPDMLAIAKPTWFGEGEGALVDR